MDVQTSRFFVAEDGDGKLDKEEFFKIIAMNPKEICLSFAGGTLCFF